MSNILEDRNSGSERDCVEAKLHEEFRPVSELIHRMARS